MATTEELVVRARWDGKDLESGTKRGAKNLDQFRGAVSLASRALGGIGFALAAREAIKMADSMTNVRNRVRLYTKSQKEANEVVQDLIKRSNNARVALESTGQLYQRLASANEELGLQQRDLLNVMDTVNKAIVISGVSADSANAAIIQLGQGLSAGALRGEELNSVMEQTPRLAQALAAGMGISIGQLRALGQEGALTTEKVIAALQNQADVINEEFGTIDATVGQAMTVLNNKMLQFVGLADDATGTTRNLAGGILTLSENLNAVAAALGVIATLVAARGVESLIRFLASGSVGGVLTTVGGALAQTVAPVVAPVALGGLALNQIGGQFNRGPGQGAPFNQDSGFERTSRSMIRGPGGAFQDANAFVGPLRPESLGNSRGRAGAFQMATTSVTAQRNRIRPSDDDMAFMQEAFDTLFEGAKDTFEEVSPALQKMRDAEVALGDVRARVAIASASQNNAEQMLLRSKQSYEKSTLLAITQDKEQLAELDALHSAEMIALNDAQATAQATRDKADADRTAATASIEAARAQRELNRIYSGAAQILGRLAPEFRNFFNAAASFASGDIIGGTISAINGVLDVLGVAGDEHERYQRQILKTSRDIADATREMAKASSSALSILDRAGFGDVADSIRSQFLDPLGVIFDFYSEMNGGDQASAIQNFLQILGGAQRDFETLSADEFLRKRGQSMVDIFEAVTAALGSPDILRAGEIFLEAELGLDGAAKAATNMSNALERATRIMFDVEEIALRSDAQSQFQQAGSDPFERAKVFQRLQDSIKNLGAREAAAIRSQTGAGTTPGGSGDGGGGGDGGGDGSSKPAGSAPPDLSGLDGLDVPWSDVLTLTTAGVTMFGVTHWGGVVDMAALRGNKAGVQYIIPWSEVLDLTKTTIDDWSDVFNFSTLPAVLAPITIGINGIAAGPRDMIRIQRLMIDDWSDMLNFPALPSKLQDINVGINGHHAHAPNDRTLISIQRTTISNWSDLLVFPALPPPILVPLSSIIQVVGAPRRISIRDIVDLSDLRGIVTGIVARNERDRIGGADGDGVTISQQSSLSKTLGVVSGGF